MQKQEPLSRPVMALLQHPANSASLTGRIWTPPNGKNLIDCDPIGKAPAVVFPASVVDSFLVRADMKSASPLATSPHVTSGYFQAARVIGVLRCGRNPFGHDSRSNPSQVEKETSCVVCFRQA